MKVLSSKIKVRLIMICILLGTIPAVIVGVFSYFKAADTIQNKVDEGNARILLQVKMSVEQLLFIADHVMLQLIESPTVRSAMAVDMKGDEFQTFSNTETVINNLPTADIGSNGIALANFSKGWVMTNTGIYKLEEYERKGELEEYMKIPKSSFWVDALSLQKQGISNKVVNLNGVSLVKKSPIYLTNPAGIVVMSIPYSRFSELVSENKRLGEVMVVGEDGCVIAHNNRAMWGKDISDSVYVKKLQEMKDPNGKFTVSIENIQYSVNYIRSEYNGWNYLSVTSLDSVTKDSKAIGWFTLFACLTVVMMVNVLAFFISDRMYMPIRKLYNLVMGIPEFSGAFGKRDELDLIEDRVNYLLKDQAKLKTQVYSQFEQLKEFFNLKLVISELDKGIIESRTKLYNYPPLPEYACVWVIRIDTLEDTQYQENDKDLMLFSINNVICELLEDSILLKPVVIEEYQVTIIGGSGWSEEQYKNEVYALAQKAQTVIGQALEFSVSIGISNPLHDYREIHRGYMEGIEALKHQILLGYNAIIFMDDIQRKDGVKPIFPTDLEKDLLEAVKICDDGKARELLRQFVERIFKVETSRHEYQISLVRLATDLIFLLKESGESYNALIREEQFIFERLFHLKTAKEVEAWFDKTLIDPIIKSIAAVEGSQYKKIVEDTLRIIHEEYDTDLTLEDCAARMNYHSSYIRRILKKEAGISFSDYLMQYRMDMAKKWLLETEMKVSDIAEKLRYKNSENFIRCFKKVAGMTPGQYRDSNNPGHQ